MHYFYKQKKVKYYFRKELPHGLAPWKRAQHACGVYLALKSISCEQDCGSSRTFVSLVWLATHQRQRNHDLCNRLSHINRMQNERLSVHVNAPEAVWHRWEILALGWDWLVFDSWLCCFPATGHWTRQLTSESSSGCQGPYPIPMVWPKELKAVS